VCIGEGRRGWVSLNNKEIPHLLLLLLPSQKRNKKSKQRNSLTIRIVINEDEKEMLWIRMWVRDREISLIITMREQKKFSLFFHHFK